MTNRMHGWMAALAVALAVAFVLAGCGAPSTGPDTGAAAVKPPAVSKILIRYCDT